MSNSTRVRLCPVRVQGEQSVDLCRLLGKEGQVALLRTLDKLASPKRTEQFERFGIFDRALQQMLCWEKASARKYTLSLPLQSIPGAKRDLQVNIEVGDRTAIVSHDYQATVAAGSAQQTADALNQVVPAKIVQVCNNVLALTVAGRLTEKTRERLKQQLRAPVSIETNREFMIQARASI